MRPTLIRDFLRLGVVIPPLPNTIQDGQGIDAVPVQDNFDWIVANVNANAGQITNALSIPTFVAAASVGGSANAITLAPNPAISAYLAGQRFSFVAKATNTAATTIATSGLATRALTFADGTAMSGGELLVGGVYDIEDNGSAYNLMNSTQGTSILNWTPVVAFGGASVGVTYSQQIGRAFKLGRLVFVSFYVQLSAKGSSTGQLRVGGLPYAINAAGTGGVGAVTCENLTFGDYVSCFQDLGTTTVGFISMTSGTTLAIITDADCSNTTTVASSLVYIA